MKSKKLFAILGVATLSVILSAGVVADREAYGFQKENYVVKTMQKQEKDAVTSKKVSYRSAYEPFGLVYNELDDAYFYKGELVRFFMDEYRNGHGYREYYSYNPEGTIDLQTVRNEFGDFGHLVGIKPYSDEDFQLRTLQFDAEKKNDPDYDIKTFSLKKEDAPDSLKLWLRDCEKSIFDFHVTHQNGRYYVYCKGNGGFGFNMEVKNNNTTASLKVNNTNGGDDAGYILLSMPYYPSLSINYKEHSFNTIR